MATRSSTLHYYINLLKAEQIKRAEGERRFLKLLKCTADLNDKLSLRERASLGPKVGEIEVGISSGVEEQLLRIAECKDVLIKELSEMLVNVAERELDERNSKAQYREKLLQILAAKTDWDTPTSKRRKLPAQENDEMKEQIGESSKTLP